MKVDAYEIYKQCSLQFSLKFSISLIIWIDQSAITAQSNSLIRFRTTAQHCKHQTNNHKQNALPQTWQQKYWIKSRILRLYMQYGCSAMMFASDLHHHHRRATRLSNCGFSCHQHGNSALTNPHIPICTTRAIFSRSMNWRLRDLL